MVRLGELMMILELHRQGLSITAIARGAGRDPKTVRIYLYRTRNRGTGLRPAFVWTAKQARPVYRDFLRERLTAASPNWARSSAIRLSPPPCSTDCSIMRTCAKPAEIPCA